METKTKLDKKVKKINVERFLLLGQKHKARKLTKIQKELMLEQSFLLNDQEIYRP